MMVIKTLLDLDTLSVEELIGRLMAVEERYDLGGSSGGGALASLNLTNDELVARVVLWLELSGSGSSSSNHTSGSISTRLAKDTNNRRHICTSVQYTFIIDTGGVCVTT